MGYYRGVSDTAAREQRIETTAAAMRTRNCRQVRIGEGMRLHQLHAALNELILAGLVEVEESEPVRFGVRRPE